MNEASDGAKPVILLLGEILLAHEEWNALNAIAQLRQLNSGDRNRFIQDLKDGAYDNVVAVSRTFDSTEITGRFDPELISHLPASIKFISHNGAGYDSIDAAACASRGISVSNTPGAVDASTATTAIFLLLGAFRRAHIPSTALRAGNWRGNMRLAHDPDDKVLGILGMGGIGSATARRATAFGMKIQYHNRRQLPADKNPLGARYVSFEELLRTSDAISVHLPLNETTRGMIGQREFGLMKEGVVFVNTARGPIVDEGALVQALESGHVYGAGLDVYENEPIVHEGLMRNDHCVLMPHVGTATIDTQYKMELLVIENLKSAVLEGRLKTPVWETTASMGGSLTNGVDETKHEVVNGISHETNNDNAVNHSSTTHEHVKESSWVERNGIRDAEPTGTALDKNSGELTDKAIKERGHGVTMHGLEKHTHVEETLQPPDAAAQGHQFLNEPVSQ